MRQVLGGIDKLPEPADHTLEFIPCGVAARQESATQRYRKSLFIKEIMDCGKVSRIAAQAGAA